MRQHEVEITGLGVCSPIGCDIESFFNNCRKGVVGLSRLPWAEEFGFASQVCGQIEDSTLLNTVPRELRSAPRHQLLAISAAHQAIEDDGAVPDAIVIGTATGGFHAAEEHYCGKRPWLDRSVLYFDSLADFVAGHLQLNGARVTISTGCTSSVDALGHAFWMIREGRWKSVLVVVSEASLTPSTLAAFDVLGAVTSNSNLEPATASRPFSKDRSGFVLAEGAAAVLLRRSAPKTRKAYAKVSGFGSVNSAFHMTSIEAGGRAIRRSIDAALNDTGMPDQMRRQISYINAHGSGTRQNDEAEAAAYKYVFGSRVANIAVNSTKAIAGHSLGAAGLVEIVHTTLSMANSIVTPAVNFRESELGLYLPSEELTLYRIAAALKTASGFSGIHSALVLTTSDRTTWLSTV